MKSKLKSIKWSKRTMMIFGMFFATFGLFALQRFYILPLLAPGLNTSDFLGHFSRGLIGDIHLACMITVFFCWISGPAFSLFLLTLGIFLTTHIPYVQFFHHLFKWSHVAFMFDPLFLRSSFHELLNLTVGVHIILVILLVGLFYYCFHDVKRFKGLSFHHIFLILFFITIGS